MTTDTNGYVSTAALFALMKQSSEDGFDTPGYIIHSCVGGAEFQRLVDTGAIISMAADKRHISYGDGWRVTEIINPIPESARIYAAGLPDHERESTFEYAVSAFAYVLPYSLACTLTDWTQLIRRAYDMSDPRNAAVCAVIELHTGNIRRDRINGTTVNVQLKGESK